MDFPSRSNEKDTLIRKLITEYIQKYQSTQDEQLLNKQYQQLYDETEKKIKLNCKKEIEEFDSLASLEKRNDEMVILPKKGKENEAKVAFEKLNSCRSSHAGLFVHVNEINAFSQNIFAKELNLCLDECDKNFKDYQQCYRQCFENGFKYTHKAIVENMNKILDEALNNYNKL